MPVNDSATNDEAPVIGGAASPDHVLDTSGLSCPMPLLKTKQMLSRIADGESLLVLSTDSGSLRDIPAYLRLSTHHLLAVEEGGESGVYRFLILRQSQDPRC